MISAGAVSPGGSGAINVLTQAPLSQTGNGVHTFTFNVNATGLYQGLGYVDCVDGTGAGNCTLEFIYTNGGVTNDTAVTIGFVGPPNNEIQLSPCFIAESGTQIIIKLTVAADAGTSIIKFAFALQRIF